MNEKKQQEWQETHTIWHRITGLEGQQLPDADVTVQIYDRDLENVVFATADVPLNNENNGRVIWWDVQLDQPLPNPAWWAEISFPEDI